MDTSDSEIGAGSVKTSESNQELDEESDNYENRENRGNERDREREKRGKRTNKKGGDKKSVSVKVLGNKSVKKGGKKRENESKYVCGVKGKERRMSERESDDEKEL